MAPKMINRRAWHGVWRNDLEKFAYYGNILLEKTNAYIEKYSATGTLVAPVPPPFLSSDITGDGCLELAVTKAETALELRQDFTIP